MRRALAADVGLAVTGIAGPGGATPEKPVGLTWIGLSTHDEEQSQHYVWDGSRLANKEYSADAALEMLAAFLRQYHSGHD